MDLTAETSAGKFFATPLFSASSARVVIAPMCTVLPSVLMPLSAVIFFKLTSRLGVMMCCLSDVTRSVPPARISVSPHWAARSSAASSSVEGEAYSNGFILDKPPLLQGRDDAVGGQRQLRHAHADGVGHGVGDGRAGRVDRSLPQPDDAAVVVTLARHHAHLELADIGESGQPVEFHVGVEHPAGS